jgi:hypothetical protein
MEQAESTAAAESPSARNWICLLAVAAMAACARLIHLRLLGPFIDETGHLYAALNYAYYPMLGRFQHGKVLGYILFYPFAKWAADPIFATRMAVALLGVTTTIAVFLILRRLSGLLAATLGGALWALLPYVVFHDRMALHDPLVSAFIAWATWCAIGAFDRASAWRMGLAGLLMSLAALTKVSALIGVVWIVLILWAAFSPEELRARRRFAWWFVAGLVLPVIPFTKYVIESIVRSNVFANQFLVKTQSGEQHVLAKNLRLIRQWFDAFNSPAFADVCGIAILFSVLRPRRLAWALLAGTLFSVLAHAAALKLMYSRYFVPTMLPLVMFVAVVIADWWGRSRRGYVSAVAELILAFFLVISFTNAVIFDWKLQADPLKATLSADDRYQYLNGWPSGTGVPETSAFLRKFAAGHGKTLVAAATYGMPFGRHGQWAFPFTLRGADSIDILPFDVFSREDALRLLPATVDETVLVEFEPPRYGLAPSLRYLITPQPELVFNFVRPGGFDGFEIYRLSPRTFVKLQPNTLPAGAPAIVKIENPNGLEKADNQDFLWIGRGLTIVLLRADRAGTLRLDADFVTGPSLPGRRTRRILIESSSGLKQTRCIGAGAGSIEIPVEPGATEVVLAALDRPTSLLQPNGDRRPLLLGVKGLRIGAFHEGAPPEGAQSATCR